MKESYDICKYKHIQAFHQVINFYQQYKRTQLQNLIKERTLYVKSITDGNKELVYDFTEPERHWGVVEGFVVHNCVEIMLDSKGMCNLTTLNVMAFVENGVLNTTKLFEAQKLSARSGYRMTCVDLELPKWNIIQQRDKLVLNRMEG